MSKQKVSLASVLVTAWVAGLLLMILRSPDAAPEPVNSRAHAPSAPARGSSAPFTAGAGTVSRTPTLGPSEGNGARPIPSTWIVGTVRREDGSVVPAVELAAFGPPTSSEPRLVETDSEGNYRIELSNLGAGRVIEVHVRGTGKDARNVLGDRTIVVTDLGGEYRIDLPYAGTELHVFGLLLWEDGEPVDGGYVSSGGGPKHRSDASGRFDLDAAAFRSGIGLSFGYESAEACCSGFRRFVPAPEQVKAGSMHGVELVLVRPEVAREFLVLGVGSQALQNAEIRISGEEKVWCTDAAGLANVRLPRSAYGRSIRIGAPSYEPRYVAIAESVADVGRQVVQLLEREVVHGRVIDSLGAPVPFAKIYVSEDASSVGEIEIVAADSGGEFSFGSAVYGGPRYLVARGPQGSRGSRLVPPWEKASEVTVVVREPYWLQGRVVSPDGAGLQGAVVSARLPDAFDGTEYSTTTDLDGQWKLAVTRDEMYIVNLHKTGCVDRDIPCGPGDTPVTVLDAAGVIDACFIEADSGEVLSRATVRIGKGEPGLYGGSIAMAQGRLCVPSPYHKPGERALLRVSDPFLGTAEVTVTARAAATPIPEKVAVGNWVH